MIVIEEPPAPPVALAEVKAFLRIGHDGEDELLGALIAERERDVRELYRAGAAAARPAGDAAGLIGLDRGWARRRCGASRASRRRAQAAAAPMPMRSTSTRRATAGCGCSAAGGARIVRVAYSAGLAAEAEALPEALRHGVVRLAAHLYTHRDREEGAGPPAAVTALWRPWRRTEDLIMFEPLVARVERAADERAAEAARLLAAELADELPEEIGIGASSTRSGCAGGARRMRCARLDAAGLRR